MKIAIDISQIVHEGTGVASYTTNLVENILKLDKKNSYILFGASLRKKSILDKYVNRLRDQGLNFKTSFWLLPPTFTSEIWNQLHHVKIEKLVGKIDVFHSSDWTQPPTLAKKVTTIHDLVVYKFPETSTTKLRFDVKQFAPIPSIVDTQKMRLDWVKKECDKVIAVSQNTKKDIESILKISDKKISVIYEAVGKEYLAFQNKSPSEKAKEMAIVKKKYQLADNFILTQGSVGTRKNTASVVDAFQKLAIPGLELAITGNYEIKKANVHSLGFVPQADMPALFAASKAFVFPSLYEGFGLPVLEAMTCETIVICSNVSSLTEVGGTTALYVDPQSVDDIAKKIKQALHQSQSERKNWIQKETAQANKFSWDMAASETIKLYESFA